MRANAMPLGGRIEIREVWGTRPRIEVGGQYLVRGKYVLPPGQRGKLYFYETAEGKPKETPSPDPAALAWLGQAGGWGGLTTTLDLQTAVVDKQEGEFALVHGMAGPGYFHLVLADPELTVKEIEDLPGSVTVRAWSEKGIAEFEDRSRKDELVIRMKYKGWTKVIRLTLSSGRIVKE